MIILQWFQSNIKILFLNYICIIQHILQIYLIAMGQSFNAAMILRGSAYGLIKTTKNVKTISTVSSKLSCLSFSMFAVDIQFISDI